MARWRRQLLVILGSGLSLAAHATPQGFGAARDLLSKVFRENPDVTLEGRVQSFAPPKKKGAAPAKPELGSGTLKFRHPDFISFQYFGRDPYDFRMDKATMTIVKYPKGRGSPGAPVGPNRVEGKVGEWLWSTLMSLERKPVEEFLLDRFFRTELRFANARHRLRLVAVAPGLTVNEITLEFDEKYHPKEFSAVEADGLRQVFEVSARRVGSK